MSDDEGGVLAPRHAEHWNSPFTTSARTDFSVQVMHALFPKKYMYFSASGPDIPVSLNRFVTLTNNMHSRASLMSEPLGNMKLDPEVQLLYSDTNSDMSWSLSL